MICPNNFAKEVARASGRPMPDVSDELIKNGFDSVKNGNEIKRINTQKFSSNKVENDNLNSLHNSSDEMLEMAAHAGEYEKVFKKETRGIHNVTFNDKKATYIKTDLKNVDSAIRYANSSRDKGAKHIKIRHLTDKTKAGYITNEELVNLGNSLREYIKINKEPFIDSNGARIYEWENSDGVRFRAVVDSSRRDETTSELPQPTATDDIITFYSDRNLNEPMNFKNPNLKQADIRGGKAPTTAVGSKSGLALRERIITFYSDRNLNEPIKEFGTNYAEFYHDGKGAIDKLLTEREGQVAGAFEREELGDIDLVWGEVTDAIKHKGYGLSHILDKRVAEFMEQGLSKEQAEAKAIELINKLPDIIKNGEVRDLGNGKVRIVTENYSVGMKKEWKGQEKNPYILTAFENTKESAKNLHSNTFTKGETLPLNSADAKMGASADNSLASGRTSANSQRIRNHFTGNNSTPKEMKSQEVNLSRAVVGDIQGKAPTTAVGSKSGLALRERIITFYSDRNLNEPMNFKNPNLKQADIRGGKAQTAQKQVINKKMTHALPKTSADKTSFFSNRKAQVGFTHNAENYTNNLKGLGDNSTTTANKSQEVNIQPIKEFGTNYAEFYHDGKGAIHKLLTERQGQVAGAFEREELGDIDLVWGEFKVVKGEIKGYGLSKIEAKHLNDFAIFKGDTPQEKLINGIAEIIEKGEIKPRSGQNGVNIEYNGFIIGINKGFNGAGDNKWVVTAFDNSISKSEKKAKTARTDNFTSEVNNLSQNSKPNSTPKEMKSQELNIQPIKEFGTNYAEFYHDGANAIKKLLTERQGQVAGAFEREELGDIDLVWGEFKVVKGEIKGYGLSKIEAKHLNDFAIFEGSTPQEKMANGINEIIQKGVLESKNGVDTIIYKKGNSEFRVGLSKGWNNQGDNRWIITAYNNKKVSSESIETSYHDTFTAKEPLANQRPNSTTTANKSQENILKGSDGKEYPNSIAGRWEKRVDEAFDWAYKNIYAKGVKSGIKVAGIVGRVFGSQESGAKIQRGLEKAFALQDEIGALSRLKSAYHRNNQVARMEAMKIYESLVKLKIDERVALFRMLDGQEVEPDLAGKLRPTYQKLRDKIDERAEQLISLGMLKGENAKENYIKYSYSQYYDKKDGSLGGFGIGKLKARDENLSYEDRVQLGLIEDAAIAVTQTLNSQNNQIQKAILFKSLADEYAVDQPKDGYVKVSDESVGGGVKKYGALAGKYVPSAVYDDLQNAGLVSSIFDVIRPYTNVIDHIKVNLTVKNPATHGYNVLSNSVLAFLHGDLGANLKLMKLLATNKKEFDELLAKAEAMGFDTANDDIEMRNLLMANDEVAKEALKTKNPLGYYIAASWQNIYLTKNSATGKVARSAYAWEDKWFKLARFKKNLDMGMSDEAAFSDANSAYVDYSSHFNPTIKLLDKTGVLPFFHFAVKSSIVVTKAAIKNPAKFAMLQTALIGTGASSLPYWFDSEQKDADNSRLPDWASSNYLPNLFGVKNQVQIGESGLYFNAARAMAGFRLSSIDDITGGGGLIGGLLDILRGRDSWGNDMVGKHDPAIKQLTARLDAFSKQFLPSITLGRYGRQGLAIATGNNPKNAYDEPMGLGELAGRFIGLRMINEKKELRSAAINAKNRYKKAKEKGDDGAMVVALNDFMACKAAASDMGVSLEALMKMKKRDIK